MIPVSFVKRTDVAPAPTGCFAIGDVACARLWKTLHALDDARLRQLRGVRFRHPPPSPPPSEGDVQSSRVARSGNSPSKGGGQGGGWLTSHELIVVVGASDELPWCHGVRYLAEAAPGLFVPTTRVLSVQPQLVAQALAKQLPCALVDVERAGVADVRVVPLKSALPLSRAGLERGAA